MGKSRQRSALGASDATALVRAMRRLADPAMSVMEKRDGEVVEFYFVRRNARASLGAGRLPSALALELRTRGLIETQNGAWVISQTGRAFLRRGDSGELGFIAQHAALEQVDIGSGPTRERVMRNAAESPLAWLRSRKDRNGMLIVGDDQFAAGERLRSDFTRAQMMPRYGSSWSPLATREKHGSHTAGGQADMAGHVLDARARVIKVLDAVGSEFAGLLVDVCCHLRGLERVENDYGWPRRAGKLVLQLALNALARHYGLLANASQTGPRAIRQWGGADYRPQME